MGNNKSVLVGIVVVIIVVLAGIFIWKQAFSTGYNPDSTKKEVENAANKGTEGVAPGAPASSPKGGLPLPGGKGAR
jgi:cytoskeletal protein RodZ